MCDGKAAEGKFRKQRLDIAKNRFSCRRIPIVANRDGATQAIEDVLRAKVLGDLAEEPLRMKLAIVVRNYPGGFLAAMLKRMQAKNGVRGGVFMTEDPEDPTFVVETIFIMGVKRWRNRGAVEQFHWLSLVRRS